MSRHAHTCARELFVIVIGHGVESSRHAFARLVDEKNQALLHDKQRLEEALANVRTLTGLRPICASCKRIRDDRRYWNPLEAYLGQDSGVVFSHGICPECSRKLYPDLFPPSEIHLIQYVAVQGPWDNTAVLIHFNPPIRHRPQRTVAQAVLSPRVLAAYGASG